MHKIVNEPSEKASLKRIMGLVYSAAQAANFKNLKQLDLHLSLSKHLPLKIFQIEKFVQQIETIAKEFDTFSLTLKGITKFTNESNTKHFISINVNHGSQIVSLSLT